jgi:hypothetical protein
MQNYSKASEETIFLVYHFDLKAIKLQLLDKKLSSSLFLELLIPDFYPLQIAKSFLNFNFRIRNQRDWVIIPILLLLLECLFCLLVERIAPSIAFKLNPIFARTDLRDNIEA